MNQKGDNVLLGPPQKQGLYDPQYEHDACGVGGQGFKVLSTYIVEKGASPAS